jgi:elongation factor G
MTQEADSDARRNIGIIAHIDAGKTTTTERILYYSGLIHRMGEVHDGNTVMDWMDQERDRGITITSAAISCEWRDTKITIIDTPGHVDFTVEVERSLKVLDGAVAIFDAVGGVEPQSETVWRQSDRYHVPKIAFVNKMDRVGADFYMVCDMIREKLNTMPVPVQIPVGSEGDFDGVIDLITMKRFRYDEGTRGATVMETEDLGDMHQRAHEARAHLLDSVCDFSDELMECMLEEKEPAPVMIRQAIRAAVVQNKLVPILCGSALKDKGVQQLMNAIIDYLPSPRQRDGVWGVDPASDLAIHRKPDAEEPFCALVFKIAADVHLGRIAYARIYSGTIAVGETVANPRLHTHERITRIFQMRSNRKKTLKQAQWGQIVAFAGLKKTKTGDTVCAKDAPVLIEKMNFERPVVSRAIEPKQADGEEKLDNALKRLEDEDPTCQVVMDKETGQKLLSGMGELHLDVLLDRLEKEFNVGVHIGKPQVAYKETIARKVTQDVEFDQELGGRNQYAAMTIEATPREHGEDIEIYTTSDIGQNTDIPQEFVDAARSGAMEACSSGVMSGYPLIAVSIAITRIRVSEDYSTEMAFKIAGTNAVRQACLKAGGVVMEPVMSVEVTAPEDYVGKVINDLNGRRAKVVNISTRHNNGVVDAHAPLAEMFGYATHLRSLTQGKAVSTMQFYRYEKTDPQIQQKILERIGRSTPVQYAHE